MTANQTNYKLVALHMAFTAVRRNGCLYGHETLHSFYMQNMRGKLSYNTFVKLIKLAKGEGIFCLQEGTWRFKSREFIHVKLDTPFYKLNTSEKIRDHEYDFRFLNKIVPYKTYKTLTHVQTVAALTEAVVIFNFCDQYKKRNNRVEAIIPILKSRLDCKTNVKGLGGASSYAAFKRNRKATQSAMYQLEDSMNINIVTGSNHIKNLVGCGKTKANTLLRRLVTKGYINRYLVYKKLENVNHYNFKSVMEENSHVHIGYNKNNQFFAMLGSKVNFTKKFEETFPNVNKNVCNTTYNQEEAKKVFGRIGMFGY